MLSFTRTGSISDAIAAARDVPERVIPYPASTALTRVAYAGQKAVVAEMPRAYDRPTPYTLRSTYVRAATVQKLQSRIAVKEFSSNNGTLPEDYLAPTILGGARKEKRFERNLRFAGILQSNERAVLATGAPTDAYGNLKRGEIQRILTATRANFDPAQNRSNSARSRRNARNAPYFAGRLNGRGGRVAIWRREGRSVKPVLVFVTKAPQYRKLLPFESIALRTAEEQFAPEFARAAQDLIRRRGVRA